MDTQVVQFLSTQDLTMTKGDNPTVHTETPRLILARNSILWLFVIRFSSTETVLPSALGIHRCTSMRRRLVVSVGVVG